MHIAFGAQTPITVLDAYHGLHRAHCAEDPAGFARALILDLGQPIPPPAIAPVDSGRGARPARSGSHGYRSNSSGETSRRSGAASEGKRLQIFVIDTQLA